MTRKRYTCITFLNTLKQLSFNTQYDFACESIKVALSAFSEESSVDSEISLQITQIYRRNADEY